MYYFRRAFFRSELLPQILVETNRLQIRQTRFAVFDAIAGAAMRGQV